MHHNSLIFHSKTRENEMLEDIKSKHESVNKSVLKKEEENNQETVHNMGKAQYLTSPKLSFVTLITQRMCVHLTEVPKSLPVMSRLSHFTQDFTSSHWPLCLLLPCQRLMTHFHFGVSFCVPLLYGIYCGLKNEEWKEHAYSPIQQNSIFFS